MAKRSNPVDEITWVEPNALHANNYNPNTVFTPEMKLLRRSLLETGWTQPIVASADNEIIDGFHRWKLAVGDAEVLALGGGRVPVVYISDLDRGDQMLATVRHNRARGVHGVLPMAEIVIFLRNEMGRSAKDVGQSLGMDAEEVDRLYERGVMIDRGSLDEFGKAWVPTAEAESK